MKYVCIGVSLIFLTNCGNTTPLPTFDVPDPIELPPTSNNRGGDLTALVLGTKSSTSTPVVSNIEVRETANGAVSIFGSTVTMQNGVQMAGGLLDLDYNHVNTTGEFIYSIAGVDYDSLALVGTTTPSSDMPTSGSARFVGTAQAVVDNNLGSLEMVNGKAAISAFFSRQNTTANVVMTNFDMHSTSLAETDFQVDEIRIIGLTGLRGATLKGGKAEFYLDGNRQTGLGDALDENSVAAFFGTEAATGKPAEFGGLHAASYQFGSVEVVYSGK